jgi:hypothetical protein
MMTSFFDYAECVAPERLPRGLFSEFDDVLKGTGDWPTQQGSVQFRIAVLSHAGAENVKQAWTVV